VLYGLDATGGIPSEQQKIMISFESDLEKNGREASMDEEIASFKSPAVRVFWLAERLR